MNKGLKVICCLLVLAVVFVLGWRVMPKVWPGIKEAVVYPVLPQLKPTPTPTPEPYHPKSEAAFGDPIEETDSVIYYFYKDYCPFCRDLEPLMAGLPKEITLADGTVSKVKLLCLNKVEDDMLKIITNYYDAHDVSGERRYVPAIVIGDKYLFLKEEIVPGLMEAIYQGEGLKRIEELKQ
ncbi:hypothetical protein JS518_03760 [Clostridiales bacterium FE2010]|nr:hypothetical protein JS518_03760 [Clostridiales bacterium FE2010]